MRRLAGPVIWRYVAILAQFAVFVLVARVMSMAEAGSYFSIFGFVAVFYVVAGFGAPDALVARIPWLLNDGQSERARSLIASTWRMTGLVSIGIAVVIIVGYLAFGTPVATAVLAGLWWLEYGLVFAIAQTVTALGRVALGGFLAYSVINIAYLFTIVPYLLFVPGPTLEGLLLSAVTGGATALIFATVTCRRSLSAVKLSRPVEPVGESPLVLSHPLRIGAPIAACRLLQGSIPWMPVWVFAMSSQYEQAAVYAAASRLTVVVTSVIASLRFGGRPGIVELLHAKDYAGLARLSRRVSVVSVIPPILALPFLYYWGDPVVPAVLGEGYRLAVPALMVLMVGVLAESFGGLSDEILKMSGRAWVVLSSLVTASGVQILAALWLMSGGAHAIAWSVVAAFVIQYGMQVLWLRASSPIIIWPALMGQRLSSRAMGFEGNVQ